jgi:hypothetical protein
MMQRASCRVLSGLLTLGFLLIPSGPLPKAAAAPQASKRDWTRITDTTGRNTDEVTEARTAGGTLHVIWLRKNGNNLDLLHTAIDKDGNVAGSPSTVLTGWSALSIPALVATGNKLYALFGGLRTTNVKDPYSAGSLYMATSDETGSAWNLDPGAKAKSHSVYASPTAATVSKSGDFVTAWAISFALQAHVGLDPNQADLKLDSRCCTYQPKLATDSATGEVVLAWYSNISKANGLYAQTILPSLGTATYVPGSASESRAESRSADQRVGLTARNGAPGIYVGYCSGYPLCRTVNVWPYGAAQPMTVEQAQGARFANIAAAPEGRLWVMWMRGDRIYATRSNRAATRFGHAVTVQPPHGTSSIWKVGGEGSTGPLDLLASMSVVSQGLATWHTRVFPPLSLSANPSRFTAAQGAKVVFTVSDVGDAVAGATISVEGKKLTTDAGGHASMTFPKGTKAGSITATASMKDYTSAEVRLSASAK